MALLDILKKAKKKVDDAIPDFNIRQKAGQAVKQVGKTISNIEQTSQRAGSQARQQVNRATPVVKEFVKEAPKQIASGLLRSAVIGAETGKKALETGEDILTKPFGPKYKERLLKLRERQSDTENKLLSNLQPLQEKKGEGFKNYLKGAYNQALPEIKNVKQSTPLQRAGAVADIGFTLLTGGAGTPLKQAGKQGLKTIAKQYGKTALVQGAGGASGAATMKDAKAGDIAKGFAGGALLGAGLKGAGDIAKIAPKVSTKVSKDIAKSLQQPKFQPGFASRKPKVRLEPKTPKTKAKGLVQKAVQVTQSPFEKELRENVNKDIQASKTFNFKYNVNDKVKFKFGDGSIKNGIITDFYLENGKPQYSVRVPSSSKKVRVKLKEKEIISSKTPKQTTPQPAVEKIVKDPDKRQQVINSLREGNLILQSKKGTLGNELSAQELSLVKKSVDSGLQKLGIKSIKEVNDKDILTRYRDQAKTPVVKLATTEKPNEIVKNKFNIDEIFNASGRYPKAGIEFTRQLKQLVTDNEMSVIKGGKTYTATKQQVSDARKLLDAIINNDLELAEQVWRRYPTKKKMVTGHTSFTPNNYVYNELSSKAQKIVGELRKAQATTQLAVEKAPVLKLATTEKPKDIPGFIPAPEAKTPKKLTISQSDLKVKSQAQPSENVIVKSKNAGVPSLTEADVNQIVRNTKKTPQEVVDSYGVLTSRISETTKKPIENIQASLTSFIRDPKKWDNKFVTPQKVLTSEELGAPKVEISQPEVKRPQVETSKVIREKVFKKEPEISATPKQKTQFEINQAKRDAQIPNIKAVPGKLKPRKSIWENIPEDSKLVTNEQANKIAREKVFGKEPEIKKTVIKLKTKVNPEKLARQAVEKATKEPISPEMPPVARVFQKADISIPETQIKAVESRLGKITDDFYQSKKGDNKIKLQDYKNLGDKVYSQAEKDFANIGSNFEDVLRKAQEDTRNGIKKLENSSLTPKEREVWKLYEAELDYIRRQASTGNKKIGGGDIGELFSPQRKEGLDTEESLLAGFRTEKPGSEFKRKNKIELEDLDYSKNPIIEYFVSYGSPKAYKAERIYKTLERENPSVNKKAISKATSEFIKLQDEINSIKTKITLGIFGERRQVSSTNQIVDSASKLSQIGDTLGLQKEIISGQPKGLTNGDRVKSVEVNGQNLMDKLGLEQYRSANTFASSQFTNAKGNRLTLSNSIRNRLQKDYNLPQENIDYLIKRIDNLAPDLSDEVVLSSVINTYRIAAKQQLLQQLQKVDIQNATLKKDVSDLTNQILREGSIESEFSNKIVKGILKSQNALFRKANLSSTLNELSDLSSFTSYYGTDIQLKPDFNTIKEFGLGSIDSAIEPYVRQISSGKGLKQVLSTMNKSLNWYRLSEIYKAAVVASSAKKVYMKQGLRGDDLAKAVLEDYRKLALPVDAFTKTWLENYPLYTQYLTWGVRNIQKEKRLATGEITGGNLPATQLERIARNAYANLPAKTIFWLGSNALKGTAILTAFGLTDFTGLTNDDFSGIKPEDKNIINKLLRYNPTTTISLLGSIYESYQKEQLKKQYKNEDYNPYEFSSFGEDLKKKFSPAIVRNVGGMLELLDKGYSESKSGRVLYEAPTELWDKTKGFLFGKQNTEQAREEAGTTSIFGREGNVFSNIRDMALEQLNFKNEDYKRPLTKQYTEAYKEADKTRRAELFKGGKEFNAYLDNLKKNNPAEYDRYISTFDGNQVSPEYWKTISSGKNGLDLTIFNTLKERNKQRKKDLGVDYDPIYDLNDQQAKAVLQQKSTATGDDLALRNILYKEAWYNDYINKVKEYYKNKKPYDGEAKKETDRVIQWNDLNSKYTELGQTTTSEGNAPEWSKRYPLVYQSKLINQKYGFGSDQSKNFYKNNGDNYKAQKALYDSENLDLINQMRSIENVPMLSPEAYSQATNIKNIAKNSGKGGKGGKGGRKALTLKVPKIKGNLRLIDLKNQPKPTVLKLSRKLPKPVLRLKARQGVGIKPLTTNKIKVKYK